jgi:hypothetical protein
MGTCPRCSNAVTFVRMEDVRVHSVGERWNGVMYVCSSCDCVLSVAIDPIALKGDVVHELVEALRKD